MSRFFNMDGDRFIYHTHPGGTPYASDADRQFLADMEEAGNVQPTSAVIPVGGDGAVRFDKKVSRK